MRTKISTFACKDCKWCPELFTDDDAPPSKSVIITDDFNGEIFMSKEQFRETKRSLTVLCKTCLFCPEIFIDESAEERKQVTISDDFGNIVYMSTEQLSVFVEQAKAGKLEI